MIRLTLFYLFAFLSALSVLLLFFVKNYKKSALLFANAFLCSSVVCVIFRQPLPALAILLIGTLCSFVFFYSSSRLEERTVSARGITPKYLKFFSGLCCAVLFCSILISVEELKDSSVSSEKAADNPVRTEKSDYGIYISGLAALAVFSIFPGRKILSYTEEEDDD